MKHLEFEEVSLEEALESSTVERKRREQGFVMIDAQSLKRLVDLFHTRELKPSDGAVFWALVSRMDTFNGRIEATPSTIAAVLNMRQSNVASSFSRLKKHHMLRSIKCPKTGGVYQLLNPWIVRAGKRSAQGYAQICFQEA